VNALLTNMVVARYKPASVREGCQALIIFAAARILLPCWFLEDWYTGHSLSGQRMWTEEVIYRFTWVN